MYRHGMTAAELDDFHDALRNSHKIRVIVDLLNLNHEVIGSVTPKVLDGQVMGDRFGFGQPFGPQRRLTLTLLDPRNALNVDTRDPDDGTVYYDRLVRVWYCVYVAAREDWVEIPVFTGPPWKLQRTEDEVYIEADDVSVLGGGDAWRPLTIIKGAKKVRAIRRILSERGGFDAIDLPQRPGKLAHAASLGRRQHPWQFAARIAASMDLHLFVDGRGRAVARKLPKHALWTFQAGEHGEIVDPVALSTERGNFANVVEVIGRKPKGEKRRVRYVAVAKRNHPHSPWSLAHNGEPYFKRETIENDHFRSVKECRRKAERVLEDRLRSFTETTCSILPWPHIEPGDMARFDTLGGEPTRDRIDSFTLPLNVAGAEPMTIGWRSNPAPHKRRVRR